MKTNCNRALGCLVFTFALSRAICDAFTNLDFEAAMNLPVTRPANVATTNALPAWTAYLGTNQQSTILYDGLTIGSPAVSLLDSNYLGGFPPLQGSFFVALIGGFTSGSEIDATIGQLGMVPLSANSVRFRAAPGVGDFNLQLSGQSLPMLALSNGPGYTLFGADVSQFRGQTAELKLTAVSDYLSLGLNVWYLDSIQFSPIVIPEPGVMALFALGGGLLVWRIRLRG